MAGKRAEIIATTCELLELQGYQATGLNQILAESGAPKGSLYHYFPDGKDGLVEEAIAQTAAQIAARLTAALAGDAAPALLIPAFLRELAHHVQASGYRTGGPITAVALEAASTNARLNEACRRAYGLWQEIIAQKLRHSGMEPVRAQRLGRVVISLIEGAIILSRTERNVAPLLDAATELEALL